MNKKKSNSGVACWKPGLSIFKISSFSCFLLSNIVLAKLSMWKRQPKNTQQKKKCQRAMPLLIPHFCCCLFSFRCKRKRFIQNYCDLIVGGKK